jgi:MFS transporter, DHA1 family, tetracycline resistance protein
VDGILTNEKECVVLKNSPLLSIFLIVLVDVLGLTIILPLLPFYAESLGASPAVVGLLISTYAFCQLIAGPPLGQISDRVGRRPVLLVSQIGTFIGFLILAYANVLWLVFLSRIIDGLTAGNLTVAQAYISDVTKPQDRARAFGMIGVAFGLGFLVGPAVSGFLAQFGNSYPIFAAAGLSLTSILCTYFLLPGVPPHPSPETESARRWRVYVDAFKDGRLGPLLWQFFTFTFAFATFISGFALFAERRFTYDDAPFGAKEVGYVFAYLGLVGIIIQGVMGKLVNRFGERRLVRIGFGSMAAGFALLSAVYYIPYLLLAITLLTIGSTLLRPSLTSLITQHVARHRQGMAIGLTQSLMSIAQIIAPVIAGTLIQHQFLSTWAWAGTVICGIGLSLLAVAK